MRHETHRWGGLLIATIIIIGLRWENRSLPVQGSPICSSLPVPSISQLLNLTSDDQWLVYLRQLSGEESTLIGGVDRRITTRFTAHLFDGNEDGLAFQYIEEQL